MNATLLEESQELYFSLPTVHGKELLTLTTNVKLHQLFTMFLLVQVDACIL